MMFSKFTSKKTRSSAPHQVKTGRDKLEEVDFLMRKIKTDLTDLNLFPFQRDAALEKLKIYSRTADFADPIFTKDGIDTLGRHAFYSPSTVTAREALRVLANALLLSKDTRQYLVDLGFAERAAEQLKVDNIDDEFLCSRILFLTTYDTNLDYENLVKKHQLAESVNLNLAKHSKQFSKVSRKSTQSSASIDQMALTESLKLLFNITHFYPDLAVDFNNSIPHIFKILFRYKIPRPPLQAPINYLINALMNLDLEGKKGQHLAVNPVFPKFDQKANAEHLINILDTSISQYSEAELDSVISPVLTLIRRVYEFAPEMVRGFMEWLLLPSDDERNQPLGTSDTLSARLLRLSTSAQTPNIRSSISSLMFELSGKDASKFVQNVGYGFASGFLISNNMELPTSASDAWSTGESGDHTRAAPTNFVTSHNLDVESEDEKLPTRTDEKEREAEKLFVVFEKLNTNNTSETKAPGERATQQGRFDD